MKAVHDGKVYDTEKATKVAEYDNGLSHTDFGFVEEALYETKKGALFLHGKGGASTEYSTNLGNRSSGPGARIVPMSREEALAWAEGRRLSEVIIKIFPDLVQEA